MAHVHPWRAWSTRIRSLLRGQTAASGDHIAHAWRSIIKRVLVYHDRGSALVVRTDGTAEFTDIQDAIDQVLEFNTKRKTISVASGIYAEKVIIPAIKLCLALQGEGRSRNIISWHEIAASAGTLMSSSDVIVESDHFIARDISFRDTGGVQPQTKHISKQPQSASPGIRPFCLGAISTVTKTPCMVVVTTSDAFSKALMTLFSVALNLISELLVALNCS